MSRLAKLGGAVLAALICAGLMALQPAASKGTESEGDFSASGFGELTAKTMGPATVVMGGVEIACARGDLQGRLFEGRKDLELEPLYDGCRAHEMYGLIGKYVWNGCLYAIHDPKQEDAGKWLAKVDIKCAPKYEMEWHVYESGRRFAGGDPSCTTSFSSQREAGTVQMVALNRSRSMFELRWKLENLKYRSYGWSFLCGATFGVVRSDGSVTGRSKLSITDPSGRPVSLKIYD